MERQQIYPDLNELTHWSYEYRQPAEILQKLEFWRGRSRLSRFFNDPKLKKLHEVWVMVYAGMAHRLLENMEADVCVVEEQGTWVDGQVRTASRVTEYQIAIVNQRPDRAVGREYRELAALPDDKPVKTPYRPLSIEEVNQRVREEVYNKAYRKGKRRYAGRPNLLLYVNCQVHGYSFQQMTAATRDLADKFESISVLCGLVPTYHPDLVQNAYRYAPLPEGYGFIRLHPSSEREIMESNREKGHEK